MGGPTDKDIAWLDAALTKRDQLNYRRGFERCRELASKIADDPNIHEWQVASRILALVPDDVK